MEYMMDKLLYDGPNELLAQQLWDQLEIQLGQHLWNQLLDPLEEQLEGHLWVQLKNEYEREK